jgi:UDP-glucose 4-epimerase
MTYVLVTGGAGFIGSNLIKRLLLDGYNVTSIDNYSLGQGTTDNHHEGAHYINMDICDICTWNSDHHIDLIFHLAALSRIQPSFTDPSYTFRVNVYGTEQVCEYARINHAKIVYAGSSSRWHDPYQSPYATYKYLGEEVCNMYKKTYNMMIEIVRFYNVYGPSEITDGDWAAVIGIWRKQIRDGQPLTIVGDGTQRRDFTHVNDIVDGLCKIGTYVLNNNTPLYPNAWELGSGINYAINDVVQMFRDKTKCDVIHIPDQKGNYKETLRESNDAITYLHWTPHDSLREYIDTL